MNTFLRILNALLLTAILATLIFIYHRMPKDGLVTVREPVTVQGWQNPYRFRQGQAPPVVVRIEQE